MSTHPHRRPRYAALLIAACALVELAHAGDGLSAGIEVRAEANATEIGLPIYPGAVAERDRGDDKAAVTLGMWGGPVDFRLVVLKFTSTDSLVSVANYYRDALSRIGNFVDCSRPGSGSTAARADAALPCDGDAPDAGARTLYKAGTRQRQRIVEMKQVGKTVHFQLVRLDQGRGK